MRQGEVEATAAKISAGVSTAGATATSTSVTASGRVTPRGMAKAVCLLRLSRRRVGLRRTSAGSPVPFVVAKGPYPMSANAAFARQSHFAGGRVGLTPLGTNKEGEKPVAGTATSLQGVREASGHATALAKEVGGCPFVSEGTEAAEEIVLPCRKVISA